MIRLAPAVKTPSGRPFRVLMTADTVGGVWTYATALARGLCRAGVEVHLATMGAPLSPGQREAAADIERLTIHQSRFALEWMDDPWDDVRTAGEWLLDLDRELRPDIVHLNGYAHGSLRFGAPVVVVGHSDVLSWWRAVLGEDAPFRYERYRLAVRRGLAAARVVVAVSAAMLADLETHYGPLPTGQVIHNGLALAALPTPTPPDEREPVFLAAGRLWDRAKGLETLAAVAPSLPWPLHVAGDTRHPDGSTAAAPGVTRLGQLDHDALLARMRRAAVFVHPARYEPFGLAPLEAAASGCALVLGDIPTLREIWGDDALFVPPGDAAALADALTGLARDPGLRAALAERAWTRARRFDASNMVAGYWRLYADLLT